MTDDLNCALPHHSLPGKKALYVKEATIRLFPPIKQFVKYEAFGKLTGVDGRKLMGYALIT